MEDWNQAGQAPVPEPVIGPPPGSLTGLPPEPVVAPPPEPLAPSIRRGLLIWLIVLMSLGVGAALAGIEEMAVLIAFAGIFIAAQAADMDRRWFATYVVFGAVIPLGGAAAFLLLANDIMTSDASRALRVAGTAFAIGSALVSVLTLDPRVARSLTRVMFRTDADSHSLRLAARVVLLGLLLVFPAALIAPQLLEPILDRPGGLFESGPLGGELIGYVLLAFASVGFLVRRDLPQTLVRLGLTAPRLRDLGLIAAGAGALFAINTGAEALQHGLFRASWEHDRHINEQLVRGVTTPLAVLIGITAGVGEEITLRGALQPRLGIVLTSLLFAALHVQYSWFGMLTIFAIGLVLGVLRARANTTVAIAVHGIYDMIAVFTT